MTEEIGRAPEAFHARQALSLYCSLHDTRKVGFKFSQVVTWRGNVDIVECPVGDIELGKEFKGASSLSFAICWSSPESAQGNRESLHQRGRDHTVNVCQ